MRKVFSERLELLSSAVEQVPIFDIKCLQNLLCHLFSLLQQLGLFLAFRSLHILARIMRLIDGDDNVGALLLEAQE